MELEKLKEIFYNDFKILDFEEVMTKYHNIEKREQLIQELAENQEQAYNLNKNYEKILNEISKIFIYNYKQKQELIKKNIELDQKIEKLQKKLEKEEARKKQIKAGYILGLFAGFKVAGHIAEKGIKKHHGMK